MRYSVLLLASLITCLPLVHSAEDNGFGRSTNQQDEDSQALARANELFEQGEYEEATKVYAALEEKQDLPLSIWGKAVFNHGLSLSKLSRHDNAIKEFKKILTSDVDETEPSPNLMAAYRSYRHRACLQIAQNYESSGRYADALKYTVLARDRFVLHSWCGTCIQLARERSEKQVAHFKSKAKEKNSEATDKDEYPIDMKQVVRRMVDPCSCDPSRVYDIASWHRNGLIGKDAVASGLLRIAEAHWRADAEDERSKRQRAAAQAVWYLGCFKAEQAVPLLRKVMESADDSLRYKAAEAIVKIGGRMLIPTACRIVTDREHFTSSQRYQIYGELSPYIGLKTWEAELLSDEERNKVPPKVRSEVLSFLIAAADADVTGSGNTKRLDTMLCLVSEEYRLSHERESILERLERKWEDIPEKQGNPEARKYPTEQLEALRAVPPEKRTHVKVYKITPSGIREQKTGTEQPDGVGPGSRQHNKLNPEEKKQGFEPLFDGKSMDQWRNYKSETIRPQWQIVDGAMVLTEKGGKDIVTKEKFDYFDLRLQWTIAEGGNSGIMFRVDESTTKRLPWMVAPEYQLKGAYGKPKTSAGALYGLVGAPKGITKKIGEWNNTRILLSPLSRGRGHLQCWLNDTKTVDLVIDHAPGSEWSKLVAKRNAETKGTKFELPAEFFKAGTGPILLQDHGARVAFRNIRIRIRNDPGIGKTKKQ
ncbi:MAG: family 16 glycoside hydrolase [Planctomycetota bacterium]|jgi:tetratricopeptide (TPR) repeat protein